MARLTELEKAEGWRLQEAVKTIEAMLASGSALTGTANSMLLEHFVAEAKKRIAGIEQAETAAIAEEREKSLKEIVVAVIAEREAALSAGERKQFEEFLGREFFTKADFDKLEDFYQKSWDKLSEDGKAEMSHRVWEGVRRKEYEFSELPEIVKEKEAQRLRDQLNLTQVPADLQRIPEKDRADFLRAWDGGDRKEAYEVLDRPVFAENVALQSKAVTAKSLKVEEPSVQALVEKETKPANTGDKPSPERLSEEFGLNDLKLVESPEVKPPADAVVAGKSSSQVKTR